MADRVQLDGVFAVQWNDVECDGVCGLDPAWLQVGAELRWRGTATRLDARDGVMLLKAAHHGKPNRARAMAERLTGCAYPDRPEDTQHEAPEGGLLLTDGHRRYTLRVIRHNATWLAVFTDGLPTKHQSLWVIETRLAARAQATAQSVICFASESMVGTPKGPRPIDTIREGDMVLTRDNGPRPVVWAGRSTISGMGLRRHPKLRPIRLRRGALGSLPSDDLRLSPDHRVLVSGQRAQALYGCQEVLVRAADLIDYRTIAPDLALHGVVYVHLLLENHEILFANGLPCESFHPALAAPEMLDQHRIELKAVMPSVVAAPQNYGPLARRCLNTAEAAMLAA